MKLKRYGKSFFGVSLNRFEAQLDGRQGELLLSSNPWAALAGGIFGALFMAIPFFGAISDKGIDGIDAPEVRFLLIMPLLVAGIGLLTAIRRWATSCRIRLRPDGIEIQQIGLFGGRSRQLSWSDIRGVLLREYIIKNKNSTTRFQIIELVHSDSKLAIPLYVRRSSTPPRSEWEAFARALDLPALSKSGDDVLARDSNALDVNIAEQVRSGALKDRFEPSSAPPDGIGVEHTSEDGVPALRLAIVGPGIPKRFLTIFAGVGGVLLVAAFFQDQTSDTIGMLFGGAIFIAMPALIYFLTRNNTQQLTMTPGDIRLESPLAGSHANSTSRGSTRRQLSLNQIEEVLIHDKGIMSELVITSDHGQMKLLTELRGKDAEWLRDFIISAIAHADSVKEQQP